MKKSLEYKDCPLCFRIVLSKQSYIQFSSHASKLIFDSKAEKISYRHLLNGDGYFCFMNNDSETKEDVYKFTKRGSIITIHSSTLIKKILYDFDIGEETKIDFVLTENKSKDYDSLLELTVLDIIYDDDEFEQLQNNKEMKEGITTEKIEEENKEQQNEEQKEEQKPDFDISFDIVSCNNGSIIINNKFPNERYVIEKLERSTKELLLDSLSKMIEEKIHIEKLTTIDIFDFSINITIKNNVK